MEQIIQIPITMITPHPGNRKVGGFDKQKLEQLAESIKAVGVQQPAIVRKQGPCGPTPCSHMQGKGCKVECCRLCQEQCNSVCMNSSEGTQYELVAGERRWRASKIAGKETIPCVVRDLDDLTVLKIHTIENLQREDIHPLDEAYGYQRLINQAGYDIALLASELGKSTSYVYQRLKLVDLIPAARKLFENDKITAGHAILIARLGPEQQSQAVKEGLNQYCDEIPSVRELDEWIHRTILMSLSRVSWKIDDMTLITEAGSCKACPKRTGSQPDLFADVCISKKDYCTDRSCFEAKGKAMVARREAELGDGEYLKVMDGYCSEKQLSGVLEHFEWQECKKGDEGAQRVLVVDGQTPGRLTYGKTRGQYSRYVASPEEKEKARKEKEAMAKATTFRESIYRAITAAAESELMAENPEGILALIVPKIWERWWSDHQYEVAKREGWVKKRGEKYTEIGQAKIAKMAEVREYVFLLLKLVMADELKVNPYADREKMQLPKTMKAAAEYFKIDVKAVKAVVNKKK